MPYSEFLPGGRNHHILSYYRKTVYKSQERADEIYIDFIQISSASGKHMEENRARTNFPPLLSTEGMPVYEQKKLREQRKVPKGTFLRIGMG